MLDWVVNTVSSNRGGLEDYRKVYLGGTRNLLAWLGAAPPKKFVYTSSTSVYGQTDGSVVKESSRTEPADEPGRVLAQTEGLLLDAARDRKFPAIILRVAGIYGPGRGHLFQQFLKDQARIPGRGERLLNMIHRDDVVASLVTALRSGQPGEIYNAVDDEPVPQIHFFRWLSETLGKNMPPFGPEEEGGKRTLTNKRVSNRKLRMELGVTRPSARVTPPKSSAFRTPENCDRRRPLVDFVRAGWQALRACRGCPLRRFWLSAICDRAGPLSR
jgi:nucleoside-diphosphate-sugar epimerase